MKLFLGEYLHNLDDRGRVTLPRKIRLELESRELILSKGYDNCIFGFDIGYWEKEAEKQLTQPVTEKTGRHIRRFLFGGAEKVEADKLGRILLPTHLKEFACIKSDLTIIGAGDHFEIWDRALWQKQQKLEAE